MSRFQYIKFDEKAAQHMQLLKTQFEELERALDEYLPAGTPGSARAKALAITSLETAYMWVGKALRDDQITRLGPQEEFAERGPA